VLDSNIKTTFQIGTKTLTSNIAPQQIKYKIFDLFWLQNPLLNTLEEIHPNCAQIVTISYNISFGNMKVTFFKLTEQSILNNSIFQQQLNRIATCAIYPVALFELNYYCEIKNSIQEKEKFISCYDQLFVRTNEDWQKNLPIASLFYYNEEDCIRLIINNKLNKQEYYYDFIDWQKKAFLKAAKFCLNSGPLLTGYDLINRQNLLSLNTNFGDDPPNIIDDDFIL